MGVPVPRPGLTEEYEQYKEAVKQYNRRRLQEMGSPQSYVDSLLPANQAPRCEHIRAEGLRCCAPALRGRKLCYAHTRMAACKKAGLQLPPLEDASAVALAAMQVVQQMLDGKIDRKTAAVALYGIQIVAGTLSHKPFSATPTSVVLEASGLPPEDELFDTLADDEGKGVMGSQPVVSGTAEIQEEESDKLLIPNPHAENTCEAA